MKRSTHSVVKKHTEVRSACNAAVTKFRQRWPVHNLQPPPPMAARSVFRSSDRGLTEGQISTVGGTTASHPLSFIIGTQSVVLKCRHDNRLFRGVVVVEVEPQQQLVQVRLVAAYRQLVHH